MAVGVEYVLRENRLPSPTCPSSIRATRDLPRLDDQLHRYVRLLQHLLHHQGLLNRDEQLVLVSVEDQYGWIVRCDVSYRRDGAGDFQLLLRIRDG